MSDIARKQLRQRLEMTGVEEYKPSTAQLPTASYMPVAEFSLLRWVAQHVGDPVAHNHNEQLRKSNCAGTGSTTGAVCKRPWRRRGWS